MIMKTVALVKGVEERVSNKDGKLYRSVLLYGLEGRPCDISAGVDDDVLFAKAKQNQFSKMILSLDCSVFNGFTRFNVMGMDLVPVQNK